MFASSPRRQARLAGALYLVVILAGMFAEAFVRPEILVAGDAGATARNLLAHARLYRVGLLTDLLPVVAAVAEGVLVYYLFRPVSRRLALTSFASGCWCEVSMHHAGGPCARRLPRKDRRGFGAVLTRSPSDHPSLPFRPILQRAPPSSVSKSSRYIAAIRPRVNSRAFA